MLPRAAFAFGTATGSPEELANFLATDGDALTFGQHLNEVGVVEVCVFILMEGEDFRCQIISQGMTYGSAPILVAQTFKAFVKPPSMDPFGLPVADPHDHSGFLQSQGLLSYLLKNMPSVSFSLIQDYESLHVLHLHEGDIISLQLEGTKSHC
jgi:hypothetical protein